MFHGFAPAAWAFLDALAADNTRGFFDAHRDEYRTLVAEPTAELVEDLGPALAERVHPDLRGEPRVGRSLFRINRDTRFSADKTPYKTHVDLLFWTGDGPPRTRPAVIMRLDASTVLLGAGRMGLDRAELDRHRAAVVDDVDGPALRRIVDELVTGGATLSEPTRKRVPRGLPADHPNADLLLRRDGLHLSRTTGHPDELGDERFVDWCCDRLVPFSPLLSWLVDRTVADPAHA
ncbi:MAG: TIGR02453 family protein [Actinomycetota bacterium]|nr:TIGR02453 family protein [Actinomycetota bacterium]